MYFPSNFPVCGVGIVRNSVDELFVELFVCLHVFLNISGDLESMDSMSVTNKDEMEMKAQVIQIQMQ